jgi:hypothetical protein
MPELGNGSERVVIAAQLPPAQVKPAGAAR